VEAAYAVGGPITVGHTTVVPGTDSLKYVRENWPYVLNPLASPAGKRAKALHDRDANTSAVGHSFGGLIAASLARTSVTYGAPLPTRAFDVANWGDPVALLNFKARRGYALGHSLGAYKWHGATG
jgi:surfactin synthase thioesterase subunit